MQYVKKFAELAQSPAAVTAIKGLGSVGAAAAGAVYCYNECLFNVAAGHRAVLYNRISGIGEHVYDEGTHIKLPWFHRVIDMDIKSRVTNFPASNSGSKDLQIVNATVRVLTHPSPSRIADIYRQIGPKYDEKLLPSIINEVVKAVIARYTAAELTTLREKVSNEINSILQQRLSVFNIILDDFAITHLGFSTEYVRAVEEKKVAQQEAERAKYHVLRAEQEKKAMIIKAQGDKEALELIGAAMQGNPGYLQIREIEAAREIARTVAASQNRVMLDASQLMLNLADIKPTEGVKA